MGRWKCNFTRYKSTGNPDSNRVEYHLSKFGDKYGLYLNRVFRSGRKKTVGWKGWTINGNQIMGEAKYGVKIFTDGKSVYFTIRGLDKPAKMTKIGN
jgi:hypothetical protein